MQAFVARFSANASKSKQATSRKKLLEKITLDDIQTIYPVNIHMFTSQPSVKSGNDLLRVEGLSKTIDGEKVLNNVSFTMNKDDKIALLVRMILRKRLLFKILMGEMEADEGTFQMGNHDFPSLLP